MALADGQSGDGRHRPTILALLVVCFAVQTVLSYRDMSGRTVALSKDARAGVKVWRGKNCQACHQIHGFGGFLGPDLTNVVARMSAGEIETKIALGGSRMPAFDLPHEQERTLVAFLIGLNRTGRSQPRPPVDDEGWGGVRDIQWGAVPWFEYP